MSEHESAESFGDLLDHEYDGIREYDNPCPGWWRWLFFLTFVFSAVYFFYFHIGHVGITVEKSHQNAQNEELRQRFAAIGELKPDEATLLAYMRQPEWLQVGAATYGQFCKSCHGEEGRGLVGPNMTDDYYKNIKQLSDLPKVVADGAANGSMPAWKARLHPNEIVLVSAYLATLRGKNLTGPRGQEGNAIPPWPSSAAAGATAAAGGDAAAKQPEASKPNGVEPSEAKPNEAKTGK
jgi:cytochrome c oxidase cbb3-type subunit III